MKKPCLFISMIALVALVGCGKKETAAGAAPAPAAAKKEPPPAGPRVVTIEANDAMKFDVTRIEAKPGEEIKLVLKNVGSQPKVAMGHNWVLLKSSANAQAYATAAATARDTEYLPAALQDQVLAHTKMLGPKENDEVVFKAPTEPGEYPYLCSFPAHYLVGMRGVLVVQ